MENFAQLVQQNRSCRRFVASSPLSHQQVCALAATTRAAASGVNKQPLKYCVVTSAEGCGEIFPLLKWAALLRDWPGPTQSEQPTGYIVVLCDTTIADPAQCGIDLGIAAQTITLAAAAEGLGACMLGAFSKEKLAGVLGLPAVYAPLLVIALGHPAEKPEICELPPDGSTAYFRDAAGTHFVPKRALDELIVNLNQPR